MSSKSTISLASFFIFNPEFGPKEGEVKTTHFIYLQAFVAAYLHPFIFFCSQEEKKVLFYFPGSASIDTKIKDIGLCEAIIKFTKFVIT